MKRVLLDEVIDTDYGQFDLLWSDEAGFDGDWEPSPVEPDEVLRVGSQDARYWHKEVGGRR